MPRLSRSYIRNPKLLEAPRYDDLNRMNAPFNPYPNGFPGLKEGCWYLGRVGRLARDGRPIVYHGTNHPSVALTCDENTDVAEGDWVIYELSYLKGWHAGGAFKEMFRRRFRKPV
jgi:hypothetical protein